MRRIEVQSVESNCSGSSTPFSTAPQLHWRSFEETFSRYSRLLFLSAPLLVRRFGIALASNEPVDARLTRAGHPNSAHMVEVMKQTDIRSRRRFLKTSSMLRMAAAFSTDIGESFAEWRTKSIQEVGRVSENDTCQCRT